jgi:hypothetical protein
VCPPFTVIVSLYAVYGTPEGSLLAADGSCSATWLPDFDCNAPAAQAVFEARCLLRSACAVLITPATFGLDAATFCPGASP